MFLTLCALLSIFWIWADNSSPIKKIMVKHCQKFAERDKAKMTANIVTTLLVCYILTHALEGLLCCCTLIQLVSSHVVWSPNWRLRRALQHAKPKETRFSGIMTIYWRRLHYLYTAAARGGRRIVTPPWRLISPKARLTTNGYRQIFNSRSSQRNTFTKIYQEVHVQSFQP